MTKASGVYAIIHKESGKLYVGSTDNIRRRWQAHIRQLKRNRHHSRYLQRAWNKYGPDAFAFVVVRFCPVSTLILEEQKWIDEMNSVGRYGYNSCPTAGSNLGMRHTPEARAKMGAAKRGKKLTPEHRAKMSAAHAGLKRSEEAIAKTVAAHKGRRNSPEVLARMSAAQKRLGKKLTPEHVAKIIAANTGRERPAEVRAKIAAAKKGIKKTPQARARMVMAARKREAAKKAEKLARGSMDQGELFP